MQRRAAVIALLALALGGGCGKPAPKALTKEQVTAALQAEAAAFKRDGEKLDPKLGIKATWTITALEVTEQAGNEGTPYLGTISFKINSQAVNSTDPTPTEVNFAKTYRYGFDAKSGKWQLKP